jgi:hypothetical protein
MYWEAVVSQALQLEEVLTRPKSRTIGGEDTDQSRSMQKQTQASGRWLDSAVEQRRTASFRGMQGRAGHRGDGVVQPAGTAGSGGGRRSAWFSGGELGECLSGLVRRRGGRSLLCSCTSIGNGTAWNRIRKRNTSEGLGRSYHWQWTHLVLEKKTAFSSTD